MTKTISFCDMCREWFTICCKAKMIPIGNNTWHCEKCEERV